MTVLHASDSTATILMPQKSPLTQPPSRGGPGLNELWEANKPYPALGPLIAHMANVEG
jgi:hypothetical protein